MQGYLAWIYTGMKKYERYDNVLRKELKYALRI